ncbi:MAG: class I SAM-dependent methyltransferase [Elusimicrobiota bacterium]
MSKIKYHRENYDIGSLDPHWADAQIVRMIGENKKVLEIGCANGYIGKYLKEKQNCKIFGVELNRQAAEEAREIYEGIITGDIESKEVLSKLEGRGERFEVILCSNILEHLQNPLEVLNRLKLLLSSNGCFVIALPNIAHWSIRLKLWKGNFDYTESGILDNTHLKFFTLKTAGELLQEAGLKIEKWSFDWDNGIPKFNGLLNRIPKLGPKFLHWFYSLCPALFGFQFIFKVAPAKNG